MIRQLLSKAEFSELTRPLVGQPISRTWRGGGTAIFFEIGVLSLIESKRRNGEVRVSSVGEVTLMIQWSWRVEKDRSIVFGSWNSKTRIENGIAKLQSCLIQSIEVEGRLPEVVVELSGKRWIHSFSTVESQPQWALMWTHPENGARQRSQWIDSKNGRLVLTTQG